jgi:hypothetical protein
MFSKGCYDAITMNNRNAASRGIWPLLVALGLTSSILAGAAIGCGGASQAEPTDPTTAPIATTTSEGFGQTETSDDSSYLEILADPPTDVLLDGKPIGRTPLKKVQVTPGAHDVTFNDDVGGPRTMSVSVNAGDYQTVKSDRPLSLKRQE